MDQAAVEREIIERMLALYSRRKPSYSGCLQTTIFRKTPDGPRNLLTKYECIRRGTAAAPGLAYEYPEVGIVRRVLSLDAVPDCFKRLADDHALETGIGIDVGIDAGFSSYGKTRWSHSEWSNWPSDNFTLEPPSSGPWSPSASLVSVQAPYFTSLDQVLGVFFAQAGPNWANQFRGQVVFPDFRARIARLLVAPRSYRAEARASSHVVAPVRLRPKRPARVPDTKMTHAHRFQPRARSANSLEVESSARPASQSLRWRR